MKLLTADELQTCLHERLPLTQAMQVAVVSVAADSVILTAPLAPNINHHDTVFGGSAATLAITAAWSLVYVLLHADEVDSQIVISATRWNICSPCAAHLPHVR